MQSTSNFHYQIIEVGGGIPEDIVHDMATFDSRQHMFHHNTNPGNHRVFRFVSRAQLLSPGLFLRLIRLDMVRLIALKTCIFEENTPRRKRIGFLVTDAFVVHATRIRAAEIAHESLFNVHDEVIFHGMRFFFRYSGSFVAQRLWDAACAVRCHQ